MEPGNLIGFTGKPVTFDCRVIEKNRVCKGAYKGEEICYSYEIKEAQIA